MKYLALISIVLFMSCDRVRIDQEAESLSGTFRAINVKEDNVVVFDAANSQNIISGYLNFKITFISNPAKLVNWVEHTNEEFRGTWETIETTSSKTNLRFSGLTPIPTGTGGAVEFEILSRSSNYLKIKLIRSSLKSGGTVNEYFLERI